MPRDGHRDIRPSMVIDNVLRRFAERLIDLSRVFKLSIAITIDAILIFGVCLFGVKVYEVLCACVVKSPVSLLLSLLFAAACLGIFFLTGLYPADAALPRYADYFFGSGLDHHRRRAAWLWA